MTKTTYVSSIIDKYKTKIPEIKTSKRLIMKTIKISTLMATTLMLLTTSLGAIPTASALGPLTHTAVSEAQISTLIPGGPVAGFDVLADNIQDGATVGVTDCVGSVQSAAYDLGGGKFLYAYELECKCGPNWDVGYAAVGGGLKVALNGNVPVLFNAGEDAIVDDDSFSTTNTGFNPYSADLINFNANNIFGATAGDFFDSSFENPTNVEIFNANGIFFNSNVAGFVTNSPPTILSGAHLGGSNTVFDLVVPEESPLEHFLAYKVNDNDDLLPEFEKRQVTLTDQFETAIFEVKEPKMLLNPVDKNGEGISDEFTHLVGYKIKALKGEPKFEKVTNVFVTNQFGEITVDVKKPKLLLVPSSKDLSGTPDELDPITVDHFKCYDVKVTKGTPKFEKRTVDLTDQFGSKTVEVKKPKMLCNPVEKTHDGITTEIINEENHLLCYDVERLPLGVFTNNQFGPLQLDVKEKNQLCVPSTKTLEGDANAVSHHEYGYDDPNIDTDGDGLSDFEEVGAYNNVDPTLAIQDLPQFDPNNRHFQCLFQGTSPILADTDGDGLSDGEELNVYGTDPGRPDTDFDFLLDGAEIALGTDPFNDDTDGDGALDGQDADPLNPNVQ